MWWFLNVLYVTVQSPVKFYMTVFNIFFRERCFNTQNTSLVTVLAE